MSLMINRSIPVLLAREGGGTHPARGGQSSGSIAGFVHGGILSLELSGCSICPETGVRFPSGKRVSFGEFRDTDDLYSVDGEAFQR